MTQDQNKAQPRRPQSAAEPAGKWTEEAVRTAWLSQKRPPMDKQGALTPEFK